MQYSYGDPLSYLSYRIVIMLSRLVVQCAFVSLRLVWSHTMCSESVLSSLISYHVVCDLISSHATWVMLFRSSHAAYIRYGMMWYIVVSSYLMSSAGQRDVVQSRLVCIE